MVLLGTGEDLVFRRGAKTTEGVEVFRCTMNQRCTTLYKIVMNKRPQKTERDASSHYANATKAMRVGERYEKDTCMHFGMNVYTLNSKLFAGRIAKGENGKLVKKVMKKSCI